MSLKALFSPYARPPFDPARKILSPLLLTIPPAILFARQVHLQFFRLGVPPAPSFYFQISSSFEIEIPLNTKSNGYDRVASQ